MLSLSECPPQPPSKAWLCSRPWASPRERQPCPGPGVHLGQEPRQTNPSRPEGAGNVAAATACATARLCPAWCSVRWRRNVHRCSAKVCGRKGRTDIAVVGAACRGPQPGPWDPGAGLSSPCDLGRLPSCSGAPPPARKTRRLALLGTPLCPLPPLPTLWVPLQRGHRSWGIGPEKLLAAGCGPSPKRPPGPQRLFPKASAACARLDPDAEAAPSQGDPGPEFARRAPEAGLTRSSSLVFAAWQPVALLTAE